MQLTTCPSSEQLSDYLNGKLSAQEIDEISLHIETCVDCDTAVHKLDDDSDSLMFALRQPLGEELFEQEPELQRAVAAMRFSLPESESQNSCTVLGTVREYDLLEKIGQGGMGTVYKALHSRLKRIVALKVLADHRLGDPAAVDRFSREMQAVGKLAHPNIVRALDAGEAEGRHYLVMEYIDGIDLSRLSRRCGPLPVAEASELVLQVSLALQHAHEHGLVHRDIKPSNVMLTRDGNVKLLDLGIALLQPEEPATSDLTGTGQVMGTLDYMAPEQLDNTHAVDIRADIYGLGATLYKLLCGSAPATDSQSRFRLPGESIPPVPNIRTIRGDIPKPVAAVIERMLAPNPEQRYATPADVAEALKPFAAKSNLKQLALAAAADAPSRTITPPKRFGGRLGRFVIAAAALLGMALAGFAIYVETDKGQIVIHSNVDDIQVLVKRTGKLYDALDELEVDKGDNQWKFRSGSYEVQLLGKTEGLRVKDGVFTLTRDGKAVVTIERDPARAKAAAVSGPVYEGKTLEEWLELLLMEKSVPQRLRAIWALKKLGVEAPSRSIEALLDVGGEYDVPITQSASTAQTQKIYDLQLQAIQTIQKLSPDQIPLVLLDALQDPDVKKRRYAAGFIRHYWNDDPPITLVRTAAKDPDEYVRRYAVDWLTRYGSVAIPDLVVALDDESDKVRGAAILAVNMMASTYKMLTPEDARVLEPKFYDMVDDKSAEVRGSILWVLPSVASDDQKLLAVLEAALHDPVPEVQVAAIGVLRRLGPKAAAAVPALTDALKSRHRNEIESLNKDGTKSFYNEPISAKLISALGSIGPDAKSGVPVIKEFIQHEHKDVRKAVVEAIQQITGEVIELPQDNKTPSNKTAKGPVYGDKTLDEWIALLKTQRSAVMRHSAVEPIATLGVDDPEKAVAALIDAGSDYDPRNMEQFEERDEPKATWIAIIKAIETLSPSQIPTAVLQALGDKDVKKRRFATGLMDLYQDDVPPIEAAKKAAEDSDEFVRFQTMAWVGRYGHDSVPILIAAFADQSENVRRRALEAVAHLGINGDISPDDAKLLVPRLYEMLQDKDSWVKAAALAALLRVAIDQDKLLTVLAEAVGDTDPQVMSAAIECLGVLGPKAEQAVPVLIESLKRCGRTTLKPDDILASGPEPGVVLDNAPLRLIVALGAIGPSAKTAVSTIKEFLKHDNAHIRNAAVRAIKQITGEDIELPQDNKTAAAGPVYDGKTFDEWVTLLKTDKSPQRQIEGIKALVALGTAENASRALEIVFEMGASHSIERQNDDDRDVVSAALEAIARINDAKLVRPFLLGKLDSEDAGARLFAVTVLNDPLASRRDPNYSEKTLARIHAMSGDPVVRVRTKLIEVLGGLARLAKNGETSVPVLIKMYETDKDQQVRYAAFHSLAVLGDNRAHAALPLFLNALSSPNAKFRNDAVLRLEVSKPDPKLLNEALLKALRSKDEQIRFEALQLARILVSEQPLPADSTALLPVFIQGLKDSEQKNRKAASDGLLRFRPFPKEVTSNLVALMDNTEDPQRTQLIQLLVEYTGSGRFGAPPGSVVAELISLYQGADAGRRENILQVFARMRETAKSALPLVEEALMDKDPQVRAAAEAALKAIRSKSRKTDSPPVPKTSGAVYDGKTFDEWITLLKTDRSAHRQLEGIKALASLRSDENTPLVVSTIIKIAGDGDRISTGKNDPNVAESAESILRQIGQEAAVPQLLTALESDDVTMRRFALHAISRFAITDEMTPAILKLTNDPNEGIRGYIVYRLLSIGDPGVEALVRMLKTDPSSHVKARAASALGELKEKARPAEPVLLDSLLAKDVQLRDAAIYALKELKPDQDVLNSVLLKFVAADFPISLNNRSVNPFMLVDTNSPATIPALIAAITDDDETLRNEAWQILLKYHDDLELVIPALIAALENEKLEHKETIVSLLTIYAERAKAAIPALIKLYKTSDNKERRKLLTAFEKIDLQHKDVQPLLQQAAQSEDKNLSRAAQKLLRVDAVGAVAAAVSLTIKVTAEGKLSIGDKPYDLQALKTLLAEQVKQAGERGVAVRIDAAAAVRFEAINTLIEMCKKAGVRNVSLGTTKVAPAAKNDGAAVYDGKTLDEWISLLRTEKNPEKRAETLTPILTLGKEQPETVFRALIDVASENDLSDGFEYSNIFDETIVLGYLELSAVGPHLRSLVRATGTNLPAVVIETLSDTDVNRRRCAFTLLRYYPSLADYESSEKQTELFGTLRPNLHKGIRDADAYIRYQAIAALSQHSQEPPFEILVEAITDKNVTVRSLAIKEIQRLLGIDFQPSGFDSFFGGINPSADKDAFRKQINKLPDTELFQNFLKAPNLETNLFAAFKDDDWSTRCGAMNLLIKIEADPKKMFQICEEELTRELKRDELDTDETLRVALYGLGKLGADAAPAVPKLIKLLKKYQTHFQMKNGSHTSVSGDQDEIEVEIVETLGQIGPAAKAALPEIQKRVETYDGAMKPVAESAIERISGESKTDSRATNPRPTDPHKAAVESPVEPANK